MEVVCIGLCTAKRPVMLRKCLDSLAAQNLPEGHAVRLIVVDNETELNNQQIVAEFAATCPFPVRYVHEPTRGIASARNAVLHAARDSSADWIIMLDDDQIVPHNWLVDLWSEALRLQVDVVRCRVEYTYPDPLPRWAFPKRKKRAPRIGLRQAGTGGVLFRANLRDSKGDLLQFEERFGLTGGEDRDFFIRAHSGGAVMASTAEAVVNETVPLSKLTFRAQVWHSFRVHVINTRQDCAFDGFAPVLISRTLNLLASLLSGLGQITIAPIAWMYDSRLGRRRVLHGAQSIAKAAGMACGLMGTVQPEAYRIVHGE